MSDDTPWHTLSVDVLGCIVNCLSSRADIGRMMCVCRDWRDKLSRCETARLVVEFGRLAYEREQVARVALQAMAENQRKVRIEQRRETYCRGLCHHSFVGLMVLLPIIFGVVGLALFWQCSNLLIALCSFWLLVGACMIATTIVFYYLSERGVKDLPPDRYSHVMNVQYGMLAVVVVALLVAFALSIACAATATPSTACTNTTPLIVFASISAVVALGATFFNCALWELQQMRC
jgi:hypothetical protein